VIGQVIGNYRIVAELGKGGMGVVYRAEHTQLGRPVALKMLLPHLSNDPGIVQRFFNEARAASAIDHPGIVEVYDFGTHTDGSAYLVMAMLKGESLEHRIRRAPMAPLESASVVAQVVGALAAAHARGIVHRDLKPDNIFLVPNELMPTGIQVKLLDFGIAKLADEQGTGLKTQTGALIGTPAYMSPEQCMGRSDLDHRTDLYAVGCILFHLLCGRPPFVSEHGTGMMIASHLRDLPVDPRTINPDVPDELARIVLRLLEKEPGGRFQSANELRAALIHAGATAPTVPPVPRGVATAPGSMVAVSSRYSGPEAFGATTAPTTGSGTAAQMLTSPAVPARSRAAWFVVGGLLVALTSVGIIVAMNTGSPGDKAGTTVASTTPSPAPPPAPPPATNTEPPNTTPPSNTALVPAETAVEQPCDLQGQVRSDDTRGNCCWPDQAWSTQKTRCIGKPTCPAGTKLRGEQCVAVVVETPVAEAAPAVPPASTPPAAIPTAAPTPLARQRFRVASRTLHLGDKVHVTFPDVLVPEPRERFWITVAAAGTADTSWGLWQYVPAGASSIQLELPKIPGAYEVRLHANYPTLSANVVHRVPLTIE
jgi:serine/threonine protein kinase